MEDPQPYGVSTLIERILSLYHSYLGVPFLVQLGVQNNTELVDLRTQRRIKHGWPYWDETSVHT